MRTAISTLALIVACSGGSEQHHAEQPEGPGSGEESEGFNREEQEALSELLGVDVRSRPGDEKELPPASPTASSSARRPAEDLRPGP